MKTAAQPAFDDTQTIHMLPRWVTSAQGQDTDSVVFTSGAALAVLDMVLRDRGGTLPGALLRDRMALDAAVACLKLENRRETPSDIRDAVCLARPARLARPMRQGRAGDALGPAGDMFMAWRKLARINLTASGWKDRVMRLLPGPVAEVIPELCSFAGTPIAQAGQILEVVLRQFPRQEAAALMFADVSLARALGWGWVMPLLAAHLARKDIRAISDGDGDPVQCVHRAMVSGCDGALRSAANLSRRALRLHAVAPKLRAKGSDEALGLFLSYDAVSPSGMLSPMIKSTSMPMTDRAARRLCDRLVELGVVRELTGRSTFRLYGL
jgi:hypothetical protein